MDNADAMLAAIVANPDEDTPRLVYADLLDERGDHAQAELIRVQCELSTLAPPICVSAVSISQDRDSAFVHNDAINYLRVGKMARFVTNHAMCEGVVEFVSYNPTGSRNGYVRFLQREYGDWGRVDELTKRSLQLRKENRDWSWLSCPTCTGHPGCGVCGGLVNLLASRHYHSTLEESLKIFWSRGFIEGLLVPFGDAVRYDQNVTPHPTRYAKELVNRLPLLKCLFNTKWNPELAYPGPDEPSGSLLNRIGARPYFWSRPGYTVEEMTGEEGRASRIPAWLFKGLKGGELIEFAAEDVLDSWPGPARAPLTARCYNSVGEAREDAGCSLCQWARDTKL